MAESLVSAKKKGPPVEEDDEAAEEGGDYESVKSSAVADLVAALDEGDQAGVMSALSDFVEACKGK